MQFFENDRMQDLQVQGLIYLSGYIFCAGMLDFELQYFVR